MRAGEPRCRPCALDARDRFFAALKVHHDRHPLDGPLDGLGKRPEGRTRLMAEGTPDLTGRLTASAIRARNELDRLERDAVLRDVNREVGSAAASLVSSEAQAYAERYYDWLRRGKPGAGQPKPPRGMPLDAAKIVKERVTDRALALRACGRAA
jgi:hypothetical protein